MNNKIIIINGPNLNLLGEREQSQYGSITYTELKQNCINEHHIELPKGSGLDTIVVNQQSFKGPSSINFSTCQLNL